MYKSEYSANVHGFTCVNMQAPRAQAKQAKGMNVFHVIGYIVVTCVLAGCYF